MNRYKELQSAVINALGELSQSGGWPADLPLDAITVELPRDPSHGDAATNAAMVLAKPLSMKPRDIAERLKEKLEALDSIDAIEIAGPGFINFRCKAEFWQETIPAILEKGDSFGRSTMGGNGKVNVEYVSANPTGPMHIGHARGAVVGDTIARLLDFAGYDVTKEYYINDAGAQVDVLARSAHLRYREALGEDIGAMPEGMYPGEYLKQVGTALSIIFGKSLLDKSEDEWLPTVREFALEAMLKQIKQDLDALGVSHDVFTSEKELNESGQVHEAVAELEKKGLIYRGVLEPPKGKTPEDWEPVEQTLFKSTDFGDDVDRPVFRSDGSGTYFASDIAYMQHKLSRSFSRLVMELGADHGGYVKRMKAVCAAFSDRKVPLDIILHQMVNVLENGKPMKLSKRAGRVISARDLADEVGKDVLRFVMLTRKADAVIDFDVQKVKEQSKDNPVFYVQYAHARCKSVIRNAGEQSPAAMKAYEEGKADLKVLSDEAELAVLKKMAYWPVVVEQAAHACEPHRIAFYLQELAAAFHGLWNLGNDRESLRFIVADDAVTTARLAFVGAIATVLSSGLRVLGVEPLEEMR